MLRPLPKVKVYPNNGVRRIIAFIPRGHHHVRLLIEFEDQAIILQEATIAAIVRAYAATALHPTRRAIELVSSQPVNRKHGFAKWQLVESSRSEEEVLEEADSLWRSLSIKAPD